MRRTHRWFIQRCVERSDIPWDFGYRAVHGETYIRIGLLLGSVLQQSSGLLHPEMGLQGMILPVTSPPWLRFYMCVLVHSFFFTTPRDARNVARDNRIIRAKQSTCEQRRAHKFCHVILT